MAGGTVDDERMLHAQLIRSDKFFFESVIQDAGYSIQRIQSLLCMFGYRFKNIQRALKNLGMDVLTGDVG